MIEKKIKVTTHKKQAEEDRAYRRSLTPEQRLEILEAIRIQAGKFLYDEYPTRLRRVIKVIRKERG